MDTVEFLEQLANNTHYSPLTVQLCASLTGKTKEAYEANDSDALKAQFSGNCYYASNVDVMFV